MLLSRDGWHPLEPRSSTALFISASASPSHLINHDHFPFSVLPSETIGLVAGAGYLYTPVISYASTSTTFSDKKVYSSFARVVDSTTSESQSIARFWKYNGWSHAAIVYSTDAYASSAYSAFASAMTKLNVTIKGTTMFARGTAESSALELLHQLKPSGARFFALFMMSEDAYWVFRYAHALGMTGEGFVFVTSCGVYSVPASEPSAPVYAAWNYSFNFCPYFPQDYTPEFQQYADRYRAKPVDNDCKGIDPTAGPTQTWGTFAYDSTYLLARALHRLIYDEHTLPSDEQARRRLYQLIINTTFHGVSGDISLTPEGDRTQPTDVYNIRGTSRTRVLLADSQSFTPYNDSRIMWPGGKMDTPIDPFLVHVVYTDYTYPGALFPAILAASVLVSAMCVCLTWMVLHWRESKLIKTASWRFLCIFAIGGVSTSSCSK